MTDLTSPGVADVAGTAGTAGTAGADSRDAAAAAAELASPAAQVLLEAELDAARGRPGGRVAPERELAARAGVTRAAVRRWLDDLEAAGRVSRHVGRGTFVLDGGADDDASSPADILAVRLLLEPPAAGLAVAQATPADIAELRRCLEYGEAADGYEDFERWDVALHAAIAACAHSPLLARLFALMTEARHDPVWGTAKRRTFTPARRAAYQRDHRELVDAVADRDAVRAVELMRVHLLHVREALLGPGG